jgi:hypothetical protein
MTLLRRICDVTADDLQLIATQDQHGIVILVADGDIIRPTLVEVNEQSKTISLIMNYEKKARDSRREGMYVFLSLVSQQLIIGGLEMDWPDGECQYRHSISGEGGEVLTPVQAIMNEANARAAADTI